MKVTEIDLKFEPHHMAVEIEKLKDQPEFMKEWAGSKQAKFKCGDLEFSILLGKMFYSNGVDTYEIWVLEDAHREILGDEYDQPAGRLTMKEVKEYIVTACIIWRTK